MTQNISKSEKGAAASVTALAVAVIAVLTTQDIVHWSSSQTMLVSTQAGAAIAFLAAVYAHVKPNTKKQPVALAATFTALISATLALGTGFTWWHLNSEQIAALVALVTAFIGLGSAWIARGRVVAGVTGDRADHALEAAVAAANAPEIALATLLPPTQVGSRTGGT